MGGRPFFDDRNRPIAVAHNDGVNGCFAAIAVSRERALTLRLIANSGHLSHSDPCRPEGRFRIYSRRRRHAAAELIFNG